MRMRVHDFGNMAFRLTQLLTSCAGKAYSHLLSTPNLHDSGEARNKRRQSTRWYLYKGQVDVALPQLRGSLDLHRDSQLGQKPLLARTLQWDEP
jgi:hypothetical protein